MADLENINENFDTIKTLLNSIRAQGILNTSDVDKILSGINSKLEKINTDEDIDLIKSFLTDLKQNLDERHGILVSKFGAIEALFSNLLKNSSETLKSSEVKELFDIVATNLSVFSREVVSQKESLNDITLRLDAMRSDDSQKRDIIKNISVLKGDVERVSNGFDSIVLSLNENFKTVLKTINDIDPTESVSGFSTELSDIINSSNAILSALQLMDKKNDTFFESVSGLATKESVAGTRQAVNDLSTKNNELINAVETLTQKTYKIDSLADKIDASVSIIAGLKSVISENEDKISLAIIDRLNELESKIQNISNNSELDEFKNSTDSLLRSIMSQYGNNLELENDKLKEFFNNEIEKLSQLLDVNITRTINDMSSTAETITSHLNNIHSSMITLCEKSFEDVSNEISNLKTIVTQLDENNTSSDNAIFSNISDRLTEFECSLRHSFENHESSITKVSNELIENIVNLKNLAGTLDYKMDSSVIEISNSKREFENLKTSVQELLSQDFSGSVSSLKSDLYALKQDMIDAAENSGSEISDKITNDIYGKYELLISKLDNVEDEIKKANISALTEIKSSVDNISSSIVDILSYVSVSHDNSTEKLETKLNDVVNIIKDSNLNYTDDIRNITETVKNQIDENIKRLEANDISNAEAVKSVVSDNSELIKQDIKNSYDKILEIQRNFDEIKDILSVNNLSLSSNIGDVLSSADSVKTEFEQKLTTLKNILLDRITEFKNDITCENADKISEIKFNTENISAKHSQQALDLKNELKCDIENIVDKLKLNINNLSEDLSRTANNLETSNKEVVNFIRHDFTDEVNNSIDSIKNNTADVLSELDNKVIHVVNGFNSLESSVNNLSTETKASLADTIAKILDNFVALKTLLVNIQDSSSQEWLNSFSTLRNDFNDLQSQFAKMSTEVDEDMSRQVKIIEGQFDALNSFLTDLMDSAGDALRTRIDEELGGASERLGAALAEKLEFYKEKVEIIFDSVKNKNDEQAEFIKQQALSLNSVLEATLDKQNRDNIIQLEDIANRLKNVISENIELTSADYTSLKNKLSDFTKDIASNNEKLVSEIRAQLDDVAKFVDSTMDIQAQEINACFENILSNTNKVNTNVNTLRTDYIKEINNLKETVNTELQQDTNNIKQSIQELINNATTSLMTTTQEDISSVKSNNAEMTASMLQSMEGFASDILANTEAVKQNSIVCKDLIIKLLKEQFAFIEKNIEKETDVIVGDLIEQITILRDSQKDDFSSLAANIEGSVNGFISDAVNDLKSYFDIKADNTIENGKLDFLREELINFADNTTENINKLLEVSVFSDAIDNLKSTNEVLLTTMADKMNEKIQDFILKNVSKKFEDRLNIFDKKFIDTVVDKYEEIKLLSTQYNSAFDKISLTIQDLLSKFSEAKEDFNTSISSLTNGLTSSIDELKQSFADLKAQILNKSFDEAFHTSVHNQISGIEKLVSEQIDYLNDISEICGNNLPELTEMNAIVKYGIQQSLADLTAKFSENNSELLSKLDSQQQDILSEYGAQGRDILEKYDIQGQNITDELNKLKTDIITQFINIFNQISFVAEQEEILDSIQEKHSELINILSRIETNTSEKINSLKYDINQINKKISSIISSSDEDVDYIYSLQDLESDIANLRLVLNDMKADNKTKELEELISSTNNIYSLVETIKAELPKFDTSEFKKDFDNLTEDIVSISTRTNKLILASDESYKTLQDNLQDFKLVINDLDERTKNFAHEAGLDKIDSKLGTLNTMIQNGAKTNQVFNQVFEYLAEWVDKAGAQIESISDKVETLDDIGQIKLMLEDLKAETSDNSENEEMIEALSSIFEKQAKKITSLETKLDRIIVENTINSKNNKIDISPIENTLNSFLVAMDEKMSSQQEKIKMLETKLEEVVSLVDNKDTAQLTKKVGGMDKQLAKLNKSIEKIASNVIEK